MLVDLDYGQTIVSNHALLAALRRHLCVAGHTEQTNCGDQQTARPEGHGSSRTGHPFCFVQNDQHT